MDDRKLRQERERMIKQNKIDGMIGALNVGMLIDEHNQKIQNERLKDTDRHLNDRNDYYWKLAQRAMREIRGEHVGKEIFTMPGIKKIGA